MLLWFAERGKEVGANGTAPTARFGLIAGRCRTVNGRDRGLEVNVLLGHHLFR